MNRFLTILMLVGAAVFAGCETVSDLWRNVSGPSQDQNAELGGAIAEYVSEVSKARPGILLGISVTAAGSAAFDTRTYLVDSVGNILMPPLFGFLAERMGLWLLPWFLGGVLAVMAVAHEALCRNAKG